VKLLGMYSISASANCLTLLHPVPVCSNVLSEDLDSMGYPKPPMVLDGESALLTLLIFYSSAVPNNYSTYIFHQMT